MITIKNVSAFGTDQTEFFIPSEVDETIDGTGLHLIPALIDPHVHFRVPGAEHKEDWRSGARAAIAGGVTTVLDMPNNTPVCTTVDRLREKKKLIHAQLTEVEIPLRYGLYLGADKNAVNEIAPSKNECVAIKIFMGSSTGNLLVDDNASFEKICEIAARENMLVAVHAEDEASIQENIKKIVNSDVAVHSNIRDRNVAVTALKKAIAATKKYGNRLYILHASTKEEVELVRQAKNEGLPIFLETTPHHLFLNESFYTTLGTKAQMNPPLRTDEDQEALFAGIMDGTIDTIGTDHAPHTLEEKNLPYGKAPSGVPGIETLLPMLITAAFEGKISLEKIIEVTSRNAQKIFKLESNDDVVLVDMNTEREVIGKNLKTKCGWSPFEGWKLKGWPVYTVLKGKVYKVGEKCA